MGLLPGRNRRPDEMMLSKVGPEQQLAQIPRGIRSPSAERQFVSLGGFKPSAMNDAD
jgi:hypothetical protein